MRTRTVLLNLALTVGLGAATLMSCGSDAGVERGRSDSDATAAQRSDSTTGETTETVATPTTGVSSTEAPTTPVDSGNAGDSTDVATTDAVAEMECPNEDGSSPRVDQFPAAPPMCIDPTRTYTATMSSNIGPITLKLDAGAAPQTVNSFVFLAQYHYFDDTPCHRIIPGFVIQCGDPTGTGTGGPGYEFPDELPAAGEYHIGSLAMANAGPDTNGSQFFIITGESGAALPPSYSLFGEVTAGLDVVGAIDALGSESGEPISLVNIRSMTITVE